MDIDKQFWKTIYYWIRYLKFDVVSSEKEDSEVWLANKRKKQIAIFKKSEITTQEIRFDKARVLEHTQEINQFIDFELQSVDIYYFTDTDIMPEQYNENGPLKIKFKVIKNKVDLQKLMPNIFMSKLIAEDNDKKTYMFYKKKVLSTNFLDTYMQKFTPATYLLILINVFIWLCMILYLNNFSNVKLLEVGGLVHFNVVHGEWYRLITSMFLHFNFEHILMNLLSLFIFGKIVEAILGSWRMLGIYFIAGLFGNFVSLSFNTTTISVGASGAIFGLIGSIFAMMYLSKTFNRKMLGQLLIALVILIGISLFMSNINIVAHLGGFIGGLLITLIGYYYHHNRNVFWGLIIFLLILFVAMQIRIFTIKEDNIYNKLIKDDMLDGQYENAQNLVKKTINKDYADDETYYLSGLIMATENSRSEGMTEWEKGLRLFPKSGILNYELAIANRALNDNDKALKYARKAVNVDRSNSDYVNLEKELTKTHDSKH
ncbi:rhomboid family protein [Staphylococcus simiae]|uniref:rhomboid family protein n=1 Tax=Staphylococcus simiae TaxID=308354 RepID=UPI000B9492A5|nr:rhomboid family intramembrane serine protease [Staphylococcus simiae]PNZ12418.1 rhomboid family intramembrane serine protease [Staphylococcus simiae]SNV72973.1 Putative membrane peptidase, contains TPR repeat domain [Staphylococcus simiae]